MLNSKYMSQSFALFMSYVHVFGTCVTNFLFHILEQGHSGPNKIGEFVWASDTDNISNKIYEAIVPKYTCQVCSGVHLSFLFMLNSKYMSQSFALFMSYVHVFSTCVTNFLFHILEFYIYTTNFLFHILEFYIYMTNFLFYILEFYIYI